MASITKIFEADEFEVTGVSRSGRVCKKSSKLIYLNSVRCKVKVLKSNKYSKKNRSKNKKSRKLEKDNNNRNEIKMSNDNPYGNQFQMKNQQLHPIEENKSNEKKMKIESSFEISMPTSSESETDTALTNNVIGTPDYTTYEEDSLDSDEFFIPQLKKTNSELKFSICEPVKTITQDIIKIPQYTGYKIWASEMQREIFNKYPNIDITIMTIRLGEMWTKLSAKQRNNWHSLAQRLADKDACRNKSVMDYNKDWLNSCDGTNSQIMQSIHELDLRKIDCQPIDVAAHLKLLGESLILIGSKLEEREKPVITSDCVTVLLDSLLCAMGSLICLTQQVPFLKQQNHSKFLNTLENMTYIMPGL